MASMLEPFTVNDVIGISWEELVATGVGAAVVVLAANAYHVKGAVGAAVP